MLTVQKGRLLNVTKTFLSYTTELQSYLSSIITVMLGQRCHLVDIEIVADTKRGFLSRSLQLLPRAFGRLGPVRREVEGPVEMILRDFDLLARHL